MNTIFNAVYEYSFLDLKLRTLTTIKSNYLLARRLVLTRVFWDSIIRNDCFAIHRIESRLLQRVCDPNCVLYRSLHHLGAFPFDDFQDLVNIFCRSVFTKEPVDLFEAHVIFQTQSKWSRLIHAKLTQHANKQTCSMQIALEICTHSCHARGEMKINVCLMY